jgi:hypothetical protein
MKIIKTYSSYFLMLICLSQIFYGFVYSDDLFTYHNPKNYDNILQFSKDTILFWVKQGRFLFVMFLVQTLFFFFYSVLTYKIYLFILNVLAFCCFTLLLKKIIPRFSILLWTILYLSLFQFRMGYHCPYNSFFGMYPYLVIFTSISIYFSLMYNESKQFKYLFFSIFFYLLGLMTIEIALIIPITSLIANYNSKIKIKQLLRIHLPHIIITFIYISIIIYIKSISNFEMTYIGIKPSFELYKIIKTALIQTIASFPLINLYKQKEILNNIFSQIKSHYVYLLFFVTTYFFITYNSRKNFYNLKNQNLKALIIGILLLTLPPFFISISSKYQEELFLGRGYLPLYIQNFGLATILYYFFNCIKNILAKRIIIICSFLIIFITLCYNFYVIEQATEKSYRLLKEMIQ